MQEVSILSMAQINRAHTKLGKLQLGQKAKASNNEKEDSISFPLCFAYLVLSLDLIFCAGYLSKA